MGLFGAFLGLFGPQGLCTEELDEAVLRLHSYRAGLQLGQAPCRHEGEEVHVLVAQCLQPNRVELIGVDGLQGTAPDLLRDDRPDAMQVHSSQVPIGGAQPASLAAAVVGVAVAVFFCDCG